jgi:tyrosinase
MVNSAPTRSLLSAAALAVVTLLVPAATAQAQTVQIEIGNTPDVNDDFLCWSPMPSRVRLASPAAADVAVTLVSTRATASGGAVQFQAASGAPITPANFAPVDQLSLTLPKDGTAVAFHVAGKAASVGQKDIKLQVLQAGTATVLGEALVMVRVRKNANNLEPIERDQFLDAVKRLRDKQGAVLDSRWQDYYVTHSQAFNTGIHAGPSRRVSNFLPWHRAFLLSLERELQAFNPNVTIPYWKFDAPAANVFTQDFIGTVDREGTSVIPASSVEVQFAETNPLRGWSFETQAIRRGADWKAGQPVSSNQLGFILCEPAGTPCPVGADLLKNVTMSFEESYHNKAHSLTGGWLGQGFSPADPIFFLLHANTDRAWAHWQVKNNRFNNSGANEPSYFPAGQYPGPTDPARFREGLYALDLMWPWSGKRGDAGTGDIGDDWPDFEFAFPAAAGRPMGPTDRPTPARLIDYLGTDGSAGAIGACYDDLGFTGKF